MMKGKEKKNPGGKKFHNHREYIGGGNGKKAKNLTELS